MPFNGAAYFVRLRPWGTSKVLRVDADSPESPEASRLQLTENGRLLGPAHAEHDRIRSLGRGRYSHWSEPTALYFAASDGSNPKTNGRSYLASTVAYLPIEYAWLATLLLLIVALSERRLIEHWGYKALHILRSKRGTLLPIVNTFGALLLVFALGEVYFRLTVPFTEKTWPVRYIDGVGWLFKPNVVVRHTNDLDFWTEESTNSLGFLDRAQSSSDARQRCRVALIGDSFVEAAQVKNHEKVQALLERSSGDAKSQISAAGYGFSGTGQLNQLPFYDRYVKPTLPHLVVLVFAANDFANNSSVLEALRNGWDPQHAPRAFAKKIDAATINLQLPDSSWEEHVLSVEDRTASCLLCSWHRALISASLFYRWMTAKISLLAPWLLRPVEPLDRAALIALRKDQLTQSPEYAAIFGQWKGKPDMDEMFYEPQLPPAFEEGLEFTEFAFAEFKRRVQADGGNLVILSTSFVRKSDKRNGDMYFNRLRAIADKVGILILDQHAWLAHQGEPASAVSFRHDAHWNKRGHQVAADMILAHLSSRPEICDKRSDHAESGELKWQVSGASAPR